MSLPFIVGWTFLDTGVISVQVTALDYSVKTLYRCVIFLRDQCRIGLYKAHNRIVKISPTLQQLFVTRYDPETGPHIHMICRNCGRVEDYDWKKLDDIVRAVEERTGFKTLGKRFELYGTCRKCRE